MDPCTASATIVCHSTREQIWPVLSDTDRLNFAVGMDALELTPVDDASAARYVVKTKLDGIAVTFLEQPYEWTYPERFAVHRAMLSGPLRSLDLICTLRAVPPGCEVVLTVRLQPRHVLLRWLVARGGQRSIARLAAEVGRIDLAIQRGEEHASARRRPLINEQVLQRGLASLGDVPAPLVARLGALLRQGDDLRVAAIRPFELADAWSTERSTLLQFLFRAAEVNLLETRWQIICPSCRVPSQTLPRLEEVGQHAACQFCDIDFNVNLDESVELIFVASVQVRSTVDGVFCIGGPARTPHVLVQGIVPAHGVTTLLVPAEAGVYRLFLRGGAECTLQVASGNPALLGVACDTVNRATPLSVAPGGRLDIANPGDQALHVKIERSAWASRATSAGDVMRLTLTQQPLAMPTWAVK